MAYNINKFYTNVLGLDLRVSDLLRDKGAATVSINGTYRQTGALSKRNGYQIQTNEGVGGAATIKFNNVEIGTGIITEELLSLDDSLSKYTEQTYTITYTGASTAYYDMYLDPDTATFKFDLYEDGDLLFSQDCGSGQGASDTTVAQIKTLVDAETGFAMTISDVGDTSMAFTTIGRAVNLDSVGVDTSYYTWTLVPSPGTYTTPFSQHWAIRNDADFEIASHAQMVEVLYIANGYDALHKYDGKRVYKAGLPQPSIPTDSVGSGGSLTYSAGEVYKWKYQYENIDAKQNMLVGKQSSNVSFTTTTGSQSRSITMTSLPDTSGYSVAQAVVDGTQGSTNTITVLSGHDLLAGDWIYINDTLTSSVVTREVASVTATTITILGDPVAIVDTEAIGQLKVSLWRTKADGTLYYFIKDFVNDTNNATFSYDDGAADASLTQPQIDPVKQPELPPVCRYIDVWRNQLIMTGNKESVNTVYYSDFDIENFPLDQSFLTESRLGGGNSGVKSLDNSLYIFKPRSIVTCTGDLGTDTFQIDGLSDDGVGCVANATIKEIDGALWFLGKQGVYSVTRQGPIKQSEKIDPKFNSNAYVAKRAISHYWIEKDLYMVSIPYLSTDSGSDKFMDNTNSFILVYDLYRQAWYQWDNINCLGGFAEYNQNIYFTGLALDPVSSLTTAYIYKFLDTGLEDDYADHAEAISFTYKSHWEALGEPSVFKKFLRIKIHALDGTLGDFETDKFTLDVSTEHDYVQSSVSSFSLDFSGGSLGWGNSPWGSFIWGESRLEQLTSKLSATKAKALRTVFSNSSIHENILISGYELEIAAPYDIQIKE